MDDNNDNARKKAKLNEDPNQYKGVWRFDGSLIMNQLLQATMFFFMLDVKTALALSLTSMTMFKPLSFFISENFTFNYTNFRPLTYYRPKKLKIKTFTWKGMGALASQLANVKNLSFYDEFNNPVIVSLHKYFPAMANITYLKFGKSWNQPFHLPLPNLRFLEFGNEFNANTDGLPPSITHLTFSYYFNQRVDHLPQGLTHLKLGYCFNQPVENLPASLTHLEFGTCFSLSANNLPTGLKSLTFGVYFSNPSPRYPPNLEYLKLGSNWNNSLQDLPKTIKHIHFGELFNRPVDPIPLGIKTLVFGGSFAQPLDPLAESQLQHLTLRKGYKLSLAMLPRKVVIKFTTEATFY
eukprot:TRINITY_DN4040_c0_g1_i2.p1 TRINITY_DN4040_c0_g1~~TRINITY_DN4040_c0_g1_i2.p1  ORF type:complete len:351 (+),score=58.48 TRINITY_DN4040_c0_g1_i2:104-1156(+)